MRKIVLLLFILLTFTVLVSAQTTPIFSIFNYASAGIFENELDTAASVGEDFAELDASYLFSGLGNLQFLTAGGSAVYDDDGSSSKMWGGFYMAGENPWSAFAGFTADDSTGNLAGGTTNTETTVTIGSETFSYNSDETDINYTANRLFDEMNFQGQYLFMMGDINTGIGVGVDIDENSPQATNIEQTTVYYYDSSATPGITPPVASKDYTYKNTQTANAYISSFWVSVPFFIMDGDISQEAGATISLDLTNNSTSQVVSYSAPADAGVITLTNFDNETINKNTKIGIEGFYKKEMPGMWGNNDDNRFFFRAGTDFEIEIPKSSISNSSQATIYNGGGVAGILSTATATTTETTGKSGLDYGLNGQAGHSFFFDLGPMISYGFEPSIGLGVDVNNEYLVDSSTVVTKFDNNNDGDFADAGDNIVTLTTDYENYGSGAGNKDSIIDITTTLELPVAATITPENWIFSVILGSRVEVELVNKITMTKSWVSSTESTSVSGTGVVGVPVTSEAGTSEETSKIDTEIAIATTNTIGLSMPIGDFAKLDILLFATNNLLDFDSLIIQATIALP